VRRIRTSPLRRGLVLAGLALAAGACGSGGGEQQEAPPSPALAAPVAERLAGKSDEIATALDAGDVCTAAVRADELQEETVSAINAGEVPPAFQESLSARVNELVNEVNCPPPVEEEDDDEGRGKKKGKKKKQDEEPPLTDVVPTEPIPTEPDE